MNKTKIEWCDYTWSPITGCFGVNGKICSYCYARNIANRFGLAYAPILGDPGMEGAAKWDSEEEGMDSMLELSEPYISYDGNRNNYPMGFNPTFHRYRLDEPAKMKKPQNIFVCSMSDLFGKWVPDEWIKAVFEACEKAPQHRYLFLTKNIERYSDLINKKNLPAQGNFWFGTTSTNEDDEFWTSSTSHHKSFVSIEPLMSGGVDFRSMAYWSDWVIVGAETGNRKDKVIPKREWVADIVNACGISLTPIFMKNSLKDIWGEPLIQEYPWDVENES